MTNQILKKLRNTAFYFALASASVTSITSCNDKEIDKLEPTSQTGEVAVVNNPTQLPSGKYIVVYKADFKKALKDKFSKRSDSREVNLENYMAAKKAMKEEIKLDLKSKKIREEAVEETIEGSNAGFVGKLSSEELNILKSDPNVDYIEEDKPVNMMQTTTTTTTSTTQQIDWGVQRVGSGNGTTLTNWAWIVDSGIDMKHPELNVNTTFSKSFVTGVSSPQDQNGHGTHVAGIIAAKDNTIGTKGVAAGATVVAVRVFGATGGAYTSTIANAINYVASVAKAGDVMNLSLGASPSTTLDYAVKNAAAKGIHVVIAAGNSSAFAGNFSPARVDAARVYTVSAMATGDFWASYSNYGNTPVDFCAPGTNIKSTWLGGGYALSTGTSMATPHISGILLLTKGLVRINGYVKNDYDGKADPIGHI